MKAVRATFIVFTILSLVGLIAYSQTPAAETKHFEKDGLSFDYPAGWQVNDQSTPQMQAIQVLRGDDYAELRLRVPREWLRTPQKEAEAKRIIQDRYVEQFVDSIQQAGMRPTRASATTEIGGATAEGVRIRAVLGGDPGGLDSFYRVISDRFVQLSQLGSERDMAKSVPAWDMIRNSLKVEPPPEPKPQASPNSSPAPGKP